MKPHQPQSYVSRWVVTYYNEKMDAREMVGPMQGRRTYATRREAKAQLQAMQDNNTEGTLRQFYGLPLAVQKCQCF